MVSNTTTLADAIDRHNGELEVSALWAAQHRDAFRFVDVREPHELQGPLGAAEGAENVPLLVLLAGTDTLDRDTPVVLICRSGRRSAQAARALAEAGVRTVASVEGGMIAWNTDVLGKENVLEQERAANTEVLAEAVTRVNGLPEVSAAWVASHVGRFRLVDVREAPELREHGRVGQSEHIPLQRFMQTANALDRDAPIVVMCASGGRSGRVVRALVSAGFTAAASLEGGLFGWKASGLPVV